MKLSVLHRFCGIKANPIGKPPAHPFFLSASEQAFCKPTPVKVPNQKVGMK
jgi:hypothetical protein